jgi:hypothetical protein
MLKISLTGDGLVEALKRKPAAILSVLSSKLNVLLFQLQTAIVANKLSGQMLRRRTGVLAGSVRVVPAAVEGSQITGAVQAGGGPSFYASFYELEEAGGTGGVPHSWPIMAVRARALSFMLDGKRVFTKRVTHPPLAARPFMTSTLTEQAAKINIELQVALDMEIEKP